MVSPIKVLSLGYRVGFSYIRLASTRLNRLNNKKRVAINSQQISKPSDNNPYNKCSNNKPTNNKRSSKLVRQRILQFLILISLVGMATQSLPAKAGIFDPILRLFLPFKYSEAQSNGSQSDESQANESQASAQVQDILANSMRTNPYLSDNPTFDIAIDEDERPSLMNVMHAEFLASRGDIEKALALYKREAFKNNATSVFERALSLSLRYETASESLYFARMWQLQNPEHIPAQFYVAHLALKAYRYDIAGEILTQIIEYDPQADLSEILIGIYPPNKKDQRLLLETLENLPNNKNPSIMVMQAGLLSQLGEPEVALVTISQALTSQPDNVPFITLKADIIKQLKPYKDALDYISGERQRLKDNKELYLYEIRYRLSLGQTQPAWELLIDAHNKFHDDEITLLAALVSIDIEAYGNADELLSDLASSPAYTDQAYYYLGISAERQNDYDKAKRYFTGVMQESLVLEARQKLVAILLAQNQPEQALNTLTKFSQQFDIYAPDATIMKADILRQQNKIDDALAILEEMNKRFPDDTKLLFARVQLLDNANNADAKLKRSLLDHLLLLDPENSDYKLALAVLLFDTGNDEETEYALQIARSILTIPFDDYLYNHDNYIVALNLIASDALSKQRYADVVDYLEATYEVSPTLDSGIILLRAYQGLNQNKKVTVLFQDIQSRFALGQDDISNRLQSY